MTMSSGNCRKIATVAVISISGCVASMALAAEAYVMSTAQLVVVALFAATLLD